MAALLLSLVPCWIRKVRLFFLLHLKRGSRQLGVHKRSPLTLANGNKYFYKGRNARLLQDSFVNPRPGRRQYRLSDSRTSNNSSMSVVVHVLRNQPEAAISLSLSYG